MDPERATQSVLFQRSVSGGAWTDLGTDTSSPVYTVTDDVRDLPLGTSVSYRATLIEPGSPRVTSRPVTVTTANPQPARDHVTLVGDLQSEVGCAGDWNPACPESRLAFDTGDGQWHGTFTLPAGSYSWKVAINDSWTENYGAGGAAGGDNLVARRASLRWPLHVHLEPGHPRAVGGAGALSWGGRSGDRSGAAVKPGRPRPTRRGRRRP